jgi:L-ascorbate metabolism protein UlaG (beta-lactamase superfamily)
MIKIHQTKCDTAGCLLSYEKSTVLSFWWLGQAGFAFQFMDTLNLIDPYLSDCLAEKYRGKEFPHIRMAPPPVRPDEISKLEFVLCTHRHSDHMDPGTLPVLAENNRKCRFIIPRAENKTAVEMGIPRTQIQPINAGESIQISSEIQVHAIPSAHVNIETNQNNDHLYLGYIVNFGNITIYHSGDCVPYPQLVRNLEKYKVDIAFLPINGRDALRQSRGVPGNFTFEEAVDICRHAHIPVLLVHHFGMFDFNTVDPAKLREKIRNLGIDLNCVLPEMNVKYSVDN